MFLGAPGVNGLRTEERHVYSPPYFWKRKRTWAISSLILRVLATFNRVFKIKLSIFKNSENFEMCWGLCVSRSHFWVKNIKIYVLGLSGIKYSSIRSHSWVIGIKKYVTGVSGIQYSPTPFHHWWHKKRQIFFTWSAALFRNFKELLKLQKFKKNVCSYIYDLLIFAKAQK